MEEIPTEKLGDRLQNSDSIEAFLTKNQEHFRNRSLSDYLNQLLAEKNNQLPNNSQLSVAEVARRSELSGTYCSELFSGRKPSGKKAHVGRNKILQLAFGLKLTKVETNRLLQAANCNELYPKNRRDAIIEFCIGNGYSLLQANEALHKQGYETITQDS